MNGLVETPFKLTLNEILTSAAATLCLEALTETDIAQSTVADVCVPPQYGYTASASWQPCGPRFVRISDIRAGVIEWPTVPYCECAEPGNYLLDPGDLLVARSGSVGKSFLVADVPEPAVFASYMIRLRPTGNANPAYLYWCLQSQQFWRQVVAFRRGSAMENINGRMLASLQFPFPECDIQDAVIAFLDSFRQRLGGIASELRALPGPLAGIPRIVARIEELAARIEEARGLRRETFSDGEQLIRAVHEVMFEQTSAEGVKRLEDVALLERGRFGHRPRNAPQFFGGEHPWIQIGEIEASGKYIRNWSVTLNDAGLAISRKFPRGTVLVSIAATIGAVGILDFDCCIPDSIVALTPKQDVDSEYLFHFLHYVRSHLEKIAPQSAQKNINLNILSGLPIPDLSFSNQRRIVAYLDNLQAHVDALKRLQAETAAELDALLPSVLDKAFRGEL